MMNFTNCPVNKFKVYAGANGSKIGIKYNGENYMLKFPPEAKRNKELSYANSPISEHIGCQIYKLLGIPSQDTLLGTYTYNDKEKVVVACKDLEKNGYKLKDFASLKNTIIDSVRGGYGTELKDILQAIDEQNLISPIDLKKYFWDMFVVDSLIANFDRHNGNWGFLINEEKEEARISPVYDCGSCLFSEMDEVTMSKVMQNQSELSYRTYVIPKSAIMENGKKIAYYDFLSSDKYKDLTKSLYDISSKIDLVSIGEMIDGIDLISNEKKNFYKFLIEKRKELILDKSIKTIEKNKVKNIKNGKENNRFFIHEDGSYLWLHQDNEESSFCKYIFTVEDIKSLENAKNAEEFFQKLDENSECFMLEATNEEYENTKNQYYSGEHFCENLDENAMKKIQAVVNAQLAKQKDNDLEM